MNIDKQDERLLHEILSKYKQGLISGLIQGNNVTFTPSGCRNKIVSSTGSGGGGGIESIVEGTNITVDDTDPQNPIVSAIGGSSAFLSKTKAEMDALILGNHLVAGALYEITGVHPTLYNDGTTSGTTVYLNAI